MPRRFPVLPEVGPRGSSIPGPPEQPPSRPASTMRTPVAAPFTDPVRVLTGPQLGPTTGTSSLWREPRETHQRGYCRGRRAVSRKRIFSRQPFRIDPLFYCFSPV